MSHDPTEDDEEDLIAEYDRKERERQRQETKYGDRLPDLDEGGDDDE